MPEHDDCDDTCQGKIIEQALLAATPPDQAEQEVELVIAEMLKRSADKGYVQKADVDKAKADLLALMHQGQTNNLIPPNSGELESVETSIDALYSKYWHSQMTGQEFKAALLALMYRETLAVIGDDEQLKPWLGEAGGVRNLFRENLREAAAKRYGQIRSEA